MYYWVPTWGAVNQGVFGPETNRLNKSEKEKIFSLSIEAWNFFVIAEIGYDYGKDITESEGIDRV